MPEPGKVKTRLTSLLTPEEASLLYEAFLRDALAQYLALGVAVRLYLSPSPIPIPDGLVPSGVDVFEQQGGGLGPRMAQAFVQTFVAGYEQAVIIGTDHPTLPSSFIEEAFNQLEEPYAISIGPSDDGGYYLLGMNEFYPQLFQGMAYSHPDVFEQTIARVEDTSGSLAILPTWYDVDTPEALMQLIAEIPGAPGLVHTRQVIDVLAAAHPQVAATMNGGGASS